MEASIIPNLYEIISNNANINEISHSDELNDNNNTQSVLFCWFGMFELRKGTEFGNQRARYLLKQATESPIALYLLGLLAESDLDAGVNNNNMNPEDYYKDAINFEPFNPMEFLSITSFMERNIEELKSRLKQLEKAKLKSNKTISKNNKSIKKSTLESALQYSLDMDERYNNIMGINDCDDQISENNSIDSQTVIPNKSDNDIKDMEIRIVYTKLQLQQRVLDMAMLKKYVHKDKFKNIKISISGKSRFSVYISNNWLDRLLLSFSKCDDWSWLIKNSKSYRMKTNSSKGKN